MPSNLIQLVERTHLICVAAFCRVSGRKMSERTARGKCFSQTTIILSNEIRIGHCAACFVCIASIKTLPPPTLCERAPSELKAERTIAVVSSFGGKLAGRNSDRLRLCRPE